MPNEFFSKTGHVGITSNMKYSNYSMYQISAKTDNFEFLDQINPKMIFSIYKKWKSPSNSTYSNWCRFQISGWTNKKFLPNESRENEHRHWILHIQISEGTKFYLEQTILSFRTKFAQKMYIWSKTEKVIIALEFCIFELVLNWKF